MEDKGSCKKKRIAVVSGGFCASTIPLCAALAKEAYVDVYIVTSIREPHKINEAFEYKGRLWLPIQKLKRKLIQGIDFIASDCKISFFLCVLPIHHRGGLIGRIVNLFLRLLSLILSRYDYVHVIGQGLFFSDLSILLSSEKCKNSHAFHEIYDNEMNVLCPVRKVVGNNVQVIVHSEHTHKCFVKEFEAYDKIKYIPFGLYYGYKSFSTEETHILKEIKGSSYILMYGFVKEYKGYDNLWKAYRCLKKEQTLPFKIVVAGYGENSNLEEMKGCEDFIVMNHFLSNAEISTLIAHSSLVVCPYKKASQSGIPQTAFVFQKPVVATDVGAFGEVICDYKNGRLVSGFQELAHAIMEVFIHKDEYQERIQERPVSNSFLWANIAGEYIEILK